MPIDDQSPKESSFGAYSPQEAILERVENIPLQDTSMEKEISISFQCSSLENPKATLKFVYNTMKKVWYPSFASEDDLEDLK